MVDPIPVVKPRHAPCALAQPAVVLGGHHVPAIDGQSPVLAGRTEGVRRRADGAVEAEGVLVGPDVGAVAADHERKVTKEPGLAQLLARRLPLRCRRSIARTDGRGSRCSSSRRACSSASGCRWRERRRPLRPGAVAVPFPQRAIERVVGQPPLLPRGVRGKRAGTRRGADPVDVPEHAERQIAARSAWPGARWRTALRRRRGRP